MKDSYDACPEARNRSRFINSDVPLSTHAPWYLVDLAKHPTALRQLFEQDPQPVYDLIYLYCSELSDLALSGPLLIEATRDPCRAWFQQLTADGTALALHGTDLTIGTIRDHLASLNRVRTPVGTGFFRYADPATVGSIGASLSAGQRRRILGPLVAIHGCFGDRHWALVQEHPARDTGPDQTALTLTDHNLASVEARRSELLARALAEQNDVNPSLVDRWFQQLKQVGAPSEQGLVEATTLLLQAGQRNPLSDSELIRLRNAGPLWSDKLEALASQHKTQEGH